MAAKADDAGAFRQVSARAVLVLLRFPLSTRIVAGGKMSGGR
jgi:hypothetical protein